MSSRIKDIKSGNIQLTQVNNETCTRFKAAYIDFMEQVLGLKEEADQDRGTLDGTIRVLIDLRKKARTDKNFALSDKIRDDLKAIGVYLKDGKNGEIEYELE